MNIETIPVEGFRYKIDDDNSIMIIRSICAGIFLVFIESVDEINYNKQLTESVQAMDSYDVRKYLEFMGVWDKIDRKTE